MMKYFCWIGVVALAIAGCRGDYEEFGRTVGEEGFEMEIALRELMFSYDMSMSLSFSYPYGNQPGHSGSDDGSNDESPNASPSSSVPDTASPAATPSTTPSVSQPTSAPVPTSAPLPTNAPVPTLSPVPTLAPVLTLAPVPTLAPSLAPANSFVPGQGANETAIFGPPSALVLPIQLQSCFNLPFLDFSSALDVETNKISISFAVLENALTLAMRDVLPFCEAFSVRRRLNNEDYYIGNVDLVAGGSNETCIPKQTANNTASNCFVGALTLRLYGNATQADVTEILEIVQGLLETDFEVGEALGAENSLIDPINNTASDAGQEGLTKDESRASGKMGTGRKLVITFLAIAAVGLVAFVAYRHCNRQNNVYIPDADESHDTPEHTAAVTCERDQLYGA